MLKAKFIIEQETETYVYIIDTGVDDDLSVTNDTENVLGILTEHYGLGNRRLIYRDSFGEIDEIIHESGKFVRFVPGHVGIVDF